MAVAAVLGPILADQNWLLPDDRVRTAASTAYLAPLFQGGRRNTPTQQPHRKPRMTIESVAVPYRLASNQHRVAIAWPSRITSEANLAPPCSGGCSSAPTQQPHRKPALTITTESAAVPCSLGSKPTSPRQCRPPKNSLTENQH